MDRLYYVYILTNKSNSILYTGITNNLSRRISEHKNKTVKGFTSKYNAYKLVYHEVDDNPISAIEREKQIKGGSRRKKIELIESINKDWKNLSEELLRNCQPVLMYVSDCYPRILGVAKTIKQRGRCIKSLL